MTVSLYVFKSENAPSKAVALNDEHSHKHGPVYSSEDSSQ